jgi:hypothetical protein
MMWLCKVFQDCFKVWQKENSARLPFRVLEPRLPRNCAVDNQVKQPNFKHLSVNEMGAGDLNAKKSWHPGNLANQAKVWEREQDAIVERRKADQLRKEKEEERALEEMRKSQGLVSKRLDWMYQTPNSESGFEKDKEEYLLGKKIELPKEVVTDVVIAPSVYGSRANTGMDLQSKVREDPMLMIKQREQEALKRILSDPSRVKQIESKTHRQSSKSSKSKKSKSRDDRRRDDSRERRRDDRVRDESRERHRDDWRERKRSRSRDRKRSPGRRSRSRDRRKYDGSKYDDRSFDVGKFRSYSQSEKRDRDSEKHSDKRLDKDERDRKLKEMMQDAEREDSTRASRVSQQVLEMTQEAETDLKQRIKELNEKGDGFNLAFGTRESFQGLMER